MKKLIVIIVLLGLMYAIAIGPTLANIRNEPKFAIIGDPLGIGESLGSKLGSMVGA